MYPIYIEQYPSNSVLDYLRYQEQLKKEQEAMYYHRLRQQQEQALRLRQEQERKRRLLAYYQQQQEYNKKRRLMQQYPYLKTYCCPNEEEQDLDDFLDYISKKSQSLDINEDHSVNGEASESESESEEDEIEEATESDSEEEIVHNEEVSDSEQEEVESEEESEYEEEQESEEEITSDDEAMNQDNESEGESDVYNELTTSKDKRMKLDLLQEIQQELQSIRKEKEESILGTQLDFSRSNNENITATTFENKQFLGYEDQIMKMLLRLDTIESEGDKDIRLARKNLVKVAEEMLETLDEFKHREWERASHSSDLSSEEDL